jgi:hypothetical protein
MSLTIADNRADLDQVATIGTLQSGSVLATITTIPSIATVGTIVAREAVVLASVIGISYFTGTASATIKAGPGLFWGAEANNEVRGAIGSIAGTLILFNFGQAATAQGGAGPRGTIIARLQVPPTGDFDHTPARGITFSGTLVASVIGTMQYTVWYE